MPNRTFWIVIGVALGSLALALGLGLLSVIWFEAIKFGRRRKAA